MRQLSEIKIARPVVGAGKAQMITESKKPNRIKTVFLSASAEKIIKPSNSMFVFKKKCDEYGMDFMVIDPSISTITKNSDDSYTVVENGVEKYTYIISPEDTIIVPRRTILKNTESKDFMMQLQGFGFFCLNTMDAFESCEDKFTTYRKLKQNGVPTPKTSIITSSSMNKLEDKVAAAGGQFPIVCKILNGTQGIGVFIIDSMMSLRSTLQTMFKLSPKSDIILQEKIDSDYDLRIHVLYDGFERISNGLDNYKIIGCMQRNQLAGDFRSNYSLGSTAEKGHITEEQAKIAKMAAKATGCRWAGVDLIIDKRTKQAYVIEVNSSPGTKGITTAAGDDVVGTIYDMFKDFKYTKYDTDEIGSYETVTLKDLSVDAVMQFDNTKTFTEMECSSVKMTDDEVVFVFNGATYSRELSGIKKGDALIEMPIKFNGTIYKNELVLLKQKNDNVNKNNILTGGSRFIARISQNAVIVDKSFVLTDNTTGFVAPAKKLDESLLLESDNWMLGVRNEDIKMGNFRNMLKVYSRNGRYAHTGSWEIGTGGYDMNWEVSYNRVAIIDCIKNKAKFLNTEIPFKIACKIAGVIESEYPDVKADLSVYPEDKQ